MPSEPDANWIFRVTAGPDIDPRAIVQRAMACFAAPLVVIPTAAFAFLHDPRTAAIHAVYASLVTVILIEVLTFEFRVLPFTCPWLPGGRNPAVAAMAWLGGLVTVGQLLGGIEYFFLKKPVGMAVVLALFARVLAMMKRARGADDPVAWTDTRGDLELLKIAE